MKLQDYLDDHALREYVAGKWDCSKFVTLWAAKHSPAAANAAVRALVGAGYNDVASEADFDKVRAKLGIKCPESFVAFFHFLAPDHIKLPTRPAAGDIAVRMEGLACGIIDNDYQGVFLAKPRGYIKHPLGERDTFLRVVA